jgi:hypothetical protein
MAIKIASKGYAGGDPMAVMLWPSDYAFDVAAFIRYQGEFDETMHVLNERRTKQ